MSGRPEWEGRIVVDVARLDEGGERLAGESAEGLLDLGEDRFIRPEGGMLYELDVTSAGEELLVRGRVAQDFTCVCARCDEPFETTFEDADFCRSYPADTAFLDLTEEVREAIILALPSFPVCDPGCRGRCPSCGANLNEGACGCGPRRENAGLAAGLDGWIERNPGFGTEERGK